MRGCRVSKLSLANPLVQKRWCDSLGPSPKTGCTTSGIKEKREEEITDFLEDLPLSDLRNVWFQHDGAPPHKVSSVQQYIGDTFQQQVIGYSCSVEWPPRSLDLNPLDFLLWGYIKQRVYATPPPTLQELLNCMTDACASVPPAMLYGVQRGSAVPCPDVHCC
ncbi:hypothetical protein AVEN_101443-1 [Araneus ventricosus]|uniref:Tc1-like transposase DDE domain-containing protein n=1 Tax=Araneus ventricosus TaxID=182803 RepID=A0A4Y2CX72_ARAVE|nr:hypothetical protein AVEN_101443-1 [Araneus ventricosus]